MVSLSHRGSPSICCAGVSEMGCRRQPGMHAPRSVAQWRCRKRCGYAACSGAEYGARPQRVKGEPVRPPRRNVTRGQCATPPRRRARTPARAQHLHTRRAAMVYESTSRRMFRFSYPAACYGQVGSSRWAVVRTAVKGSVYSSNNAQQVTRNFHACRRPPATTSVQLISHALVVAVFIHTRVMASSSRYESTDA